MLVCYPIAATTENWLHDSIVNIIRSIHDQLDANIAIQSSQKKWRDLVSKALNEEKTELLISSYGIRDRVFLYKEAIKELSPQQRQHIFSVMESQNRIADLIAGRQAIEDINDAVPAIKEAVTSLFVFCYEKLSDFNVRERQYQIIFNSLRIKICPFCGIERVMNPQEAAQDQDHYLAKSIYPFAAANMRNLVPMCRVCNRDYKKAIDVLRAEDGRRRLAFDPYDCVPPRISLLGSVLDFSVSKLLPDWDIVFVPDNEQVETWDSVFRIKARYKRDVLDEYFRFWLEGFKNKCGKDRKRNVISQDFSDNQVRNVLAIYTEDKACSPNIGMAGFLEPLVFEFLLDQYDQGNNRVIQLVKDAVFGIQIEEAA